MNFRKDKEDANAPAIISLLRSYGFEVTKCERPVDIHIYDPKKMRGGWAEIKVPGENVTAKRHQLQFLADLRQPGAIIRCEGEALMFASDFKGWTQRQRDAISSLLIRNPSSKLFKMGLIERTLNI